MNFEHADLPVIITCILMQAWFSITVQNEKWADIKTENEFK